MGGLCTCCRPQVPRDQHSSIKHHGSILHRKTSISATFTYRPHLKNATTDDDYTGICYGATLDINTATEEDFMTLPKIGRTIARNIVEYRKQIGSFLTVEDLALVNGVGATKLEMLRSEIHVSSVETHTKKSSLSDDSFGNFVNINYASIDQLMTLPGVSDILALKIVQYRTDHGKFHHINDLVEPARLIDTPMLLKLKSYLAVDVINRKHSRHASIASLKLCNASTSVLGVGPECIKSNRPPANLFTNISFGRPVVRIGTWNIQDLSVEKIANPGVRETVCATILENGIKVLAVQDLVHENSLLKIVDELNNPTLPNIQRLSSKTCFWKCMTLSSGYDKESNELFCGFIYDANCNIVVHDKKILNSPSTNLGIHSVVAHFQVENINMHLACFHFKSTPLSNGFECDENVLESISTALNSIVKLTCSTEKVFILGGFNIPPTNQVFNILRETSFVSSLSDSMSTDISTTNMKGLQCCDNIWMNQAAIKLFTTKYQVVRNGLTNPWIPDGWSWGGVVSNHCPVWIEVFVDSNDIE